MEFFDNKGRAVCYVAERGRVYYWDGRPLGLLTSDKMHNCAGEFVGWVRHGYLINTRGFCCLFTLHPETAKGPPPPDRKPRPKKGTRQPFPEMPPRQGSPSFPKVSRAWGVNPFFEPLMARIRRKIFGSRRPPETKKVELIESE
jgi:hypothetical protein